MRKWNRVNAGIVIACVCFTWSVAQSETTSTAPASMIFNVTAAAKGEQIVRASIPFPHDFLPNTQVVEVVSPDGKVITASLRPLTWYPSKPGATRYVRRGLLTFRYTFPAIASGEFILKPSYEEHKSSQLYIKCDGSNVVIGGTFLNIKAKLLAPELATSVEPEIETVESSRHFLWQRFKIDDPQWPRIIEVRADILGTVTLIAHLHRQHAGDGRAPDFGWEVIPSDSTALLGKSPAMLETAEHSVKIGDEPVRHAFKNGQSCRLTYDHRCIYHPSAPLRRRGFTEASRNTDGEVIYRYWRCRADEKVPMQQDAWHSTEMVSSWDWVAPLTPTLMYPHVVQVESAIWDELYQCGQPLKLRANSPLGQLLAYHRQAVIHSAAVGDDWGNLTWYNDGASSGAIYGMNRLNHCPPIFRDAYRNSNRQLLEAALGWCDNFHDQSIWWGADQTGGTRYVNVIALGQVPLDNDRSYMWRSNAASTFCAKGYDSFFLAYEETGDPRMREALTAQVEYAARHVHADGDTCRNVGDVADFVHLYEYTGEQRYLDEGLRLFRELRTRLSTGDLFDEGGKPITVDPPFIDDDAHGSKIGYAKPYIIGYALNGLPSLAKYFPDEPKLLDVIRAVADFLVESQDALGGWRYPHPKSSTLLLSLAIEHAWQITNAAKLFGPHDKYLDAVERVLRQRLHAWLQTGKVLATLSGWELATGKIKTQNEIYALYQRPADRDPQRDYSEGTYTYGTCPPDGLVYFEEVLAYYLQHRSESRLLEPPASDTPLGRCLGRAARDFPKSKPSASPSSP